jgi:hypothetical protein
VGARAALLLGATGLICALPGPVKAADDAQTDQIETITVTGIPFEASPDADARHGIYIAILCQTYSQRVSLLKYST